jgi:hypothetical protein
MQLPWSSTKLSSRATPGRPKPSKAGWMEGPTDGRPDCPQFAQAGAGNALLLRLVSSGGGD